MIQRLDAAGHTLTIFAQPSEFDNIRQFAPRAELFEPGPDGGSAILARIREGEFDLLFCPLLVLEPLDPPIPSAVMIPDIQHEFYPEYFDRQVLAWRRRNYLPSAINASVVLTPSEFSRRTIVDRYAVPPEKVVACPHDVDAEFHSPADPRAVEEFQALGLPRSYLYFPANYWPHKNHSNLLRALKLVRQRGPADLHLVCTGAAGPDRDRVLAGIRALGLEQAVRVLDYQPRRVVAELYRHAQALVFATQFEGLGQPVLEAMNLATPVITSRGGACEEIAAGAAMLVDERLPEGIAEGILDLLSDERLRRGLVARGLARAAKFSWDAYMEVLLAAFERITSPGFRKLSSIEVEEYPAISLVTPSLNMARHISATIDSVLAQGYPKLDYLVLDGGSTDGTLDLLCAYGDRIRWLSKKDNGQADAVNKGFLATQGQVFSFLNADDTYRPGALAKIGEAFRKNPRAGLIYGEAYHVDEQGEILCRYETLPFDYQNLNHQCFICQPAAFLSRQAFERAGMLDARLHFALDFDLWIRVAAENQVVKLPDYLANWRMYPGIKSLRDKKQALREAMATVKKYFGYVPYTWLNAYSCYLADGKDQFFERSMPTRLTQLIALAVGLRVNASNRRRYLREWATYAGLTGGFEGRWEDGWVSRCHRRVVRVGAVDSLLRIEGRHASPFLFPLAMEVSAEGIALGGLSMRKKGPFQLSCPLPAELRGRDVDLQLQFNKTWRPGAGDYRQLACIIDVIRPERGA
ncbi:MAG: glycosyltransferase [Candidatus Solibacter usitatus]|nr:glycosyltransferase [Candidatus Solibacter usitatus]